MRRKKVIYDAHELYTFSFLQKLPRFIRTVFEYFEGLLVRRVDTVIIVDELQRLKYEKRNTRVATVSNFPVLSDFKTGIRPAGHTLVYVGGLTEDRGILECIEAARLVRHRFKDTRLLLLGPILDKKLDQRLRAMANNEEYKGLLILFGKLPHKEVIDALAKADVGMLLLRPIGQYAKLRYPVKLFEYMASALPVVANSSCAYAEVVRESGCGLLAKDGDAQDIAAKIAYLFQHPESATDLGKKGRKAVELRYSWVAESRKLISSYGALAAK
jgi:glycosyltransferase involved in cell wall biosynthesis